MDVDIIISTSPTALKLSLSTPNNSIEALQLHQLSIPSHHNGSHKVSYLGRVKLNIHSSSCNARSFTVTLLISFSCFAIQHHHQIHYLNTASATTTATKALLPAIETVLYKTGIEFYSSFATNFTTAGLDKGAADVRKKEIKALVMPQFSRGV